MFCAPTATAIPYSLNLPTDSSCVNWNQYYTNCTQLGGNPFQGTISFDNIGLAWVAIFLVIIATLTYARKKGERKTFQMNEKSFPRSPSLFSFWVSEN